MNNTNPLDALVDPKTIKHRPNWPFYVYTDTDTGKVFINKAPRQTKKQYLDSLEEALL
jgi:hypothetical protein